MHLSKLKRIETGFTILVFWWTNIHYWSFSISKNPYFQNEATSKRIKYMNEWMNEWMNETIFMTKSSR